MLIYQRVNMRLYFSICRGVSSTRGILENQPGKIEHCENGMGKTHGESDVQVI